MSLSANDAALIKSMILRGDRQSDIAAWFRVNPGRIAEIKKGWLHADVAPAAPGLLPPPGPYRVVPEGTVLTNGHVTAAEVRAVLSAFEERLVKELTVAAHERRQTNEKLDRLTYQQAELRRLLGALERPQTPRIGRRRPLGND